MATQKKPTKPKPTKPTAPTKPKKAPAPEIEIDGVRVTNPDRALWGTSPLVTKGDLARYVAVVAPQMLRDLVGRPLSAVRHPRGALAPGFYQKHHTGGLPAAVHFVADEGFGKVERWLVVDDAAGLVALVQMGTLEFHPWGCFPNRLDVPDRVVIDLDPDAAVGFDAVVAAAHDVAAAFVDAGVVAFVKSRRPCARAASLSTFSATCAARRRWRRSRRARGRALPSLCRWRGTS